MNKKIKRGFTLAEVLITLGVIGVVAAVTMPTLVTNVQDKVKKEQVRTVKYKLTKATDTMNSLGKIGAYGTLEAGDATEKFVDELKKHMSIAKICKSNELDKCWPSAKVNAYQNNSTTLSEIATSSLTTGSSLKALALSTKNTRTVGLVTGDGVPMIMVYSPVCQALDETKNYTWSVENGKPVTNATTNCISAIFDINGAKGPNKIGHDVRTLNALFGSTDLGVVTGISSEKCNKVRTIYGINACCTDCDRQANKDTWAAGVIACADLGLHLPDMMTLANIANSRYGTTQIGAYTLFLNYIPPAGQSCKDYFVNSGKWGDAEYRAANSDAIICGADTSSKADSGINNDDLNILATQNATYWSSSESSASLAYRRYINTDGSNWIRNARYISTSSLCVGD